MRAHNLDHTALLVIDLQNGIDDIATGPRNHPDCEQNVKALIEAWRSATRPIVFVRHDNLAEDSPFRPGQSGNDFKPEVTGEPDLLVVKQTSSAFHGEPDLHAWLQEQQVDRIAVVGAQTNYCCEAAVRSARDLGYKSLFVFDATYTFGEPAYGGGTLTADELSRATATVLEGSFAEVVMTAELLKLASS